MATLPDEIKRTGIAAFKVLRERCRTFGWRWGKLRDKFALDAQFYATGMNAPSAMMATALAQHADRMRQDCIKVLNYLYEAGRTFFDEGKEDDLGALPIIPAVAVFGTLTSLVLLVAWLNWLELQEKKLAHVERADTRRLKQAHTYMNIAQDTKSEPVRQAALKAAGQYDKAASEGMPKPPGEGSGLLGWVVKGGLLWAAWKYGPGLFKKARTARG